MVHHLRWNSGAISRSASACGRLSAAIERLAGLRRGERAERRLERPPADRSGCRAGASWLAISSRCARPSIQAALSSAKPLGAGGRHSGSPSRFCACRIGRTSGGCAAGRAQHADHPFARTLELGARERPGFRAPPTSVLATSLRSPSVSRKRLVSRRPDAGGGSSATKWRASLVATCRAVAGMARQHLQHRAALLETGIRIVSADHASAAAGLVQARIEHELAAVIRIRRGGKNAPAGDDLGEIGDVGLRIDGAHAERMQLEDLAREILVEALVAVEAGHRIGADRARIVEIEQHGRMGLDRQQHVGEPAEHMRADRLALIGARQHGRSRPCAETQKWFDQNHTSRSTKPISESMAAR